MQGRAEVSSISKASFTKLIPFYVVEQSFRCCICVHCYRGKLVTIALCELWPDLHRGATTGSPCDCQCDFCRDGGCATFLPYAGPNDVFSMGRLSDKLLCPKEHLYPTRDGGRVEAHRAACVSGTCPKCQRTQDRFFGCPRNQGDAARQVKPRAETPTTTTENLSQRPPGIIGWNMFTTVDEKGLPASANGSSGRARRQAGDADDGDAEWEASGGRDKQRPRKVSQTSLHVDKEGTIQRYARTKGVRVVPCANIITLSCLNAPPNIEIRQSK